MHSTINTCDTCTAYTIYRKKKLDAPITAARVPFVTPLKHLSPLASKSTHGTSLTDKLSNFFCGSPSVAVGTAVAQWLRCCSTNRKVADSTPAGVSGYFIDIKSFRSHYGPGVDSASNRNEYQEYTLGVKAAGT